MEYRRTVQIYTDGACLGSAGRGGWGAVLICEGFEKEREISGHEGADTTNIRMEMTAIIKALENLKYPSIVTVVTDCEMIVKGMNEWLPNWKIKNWKRAGRKDVKNKDLWIALEQATNRHKVTFEWVKGHTGVRPNERADSLAYEAMCEEH